MARADMGAGRAPARSPETSMGWGPAWGPVGTHWDPGPTAGAARIVLTREFYATTPPPVSK